MVLVLLIVGSSVVGWFLSDIIKESETLVMPISLMSDCGSSWVGVIWTDWVLGSKLLFKSVGLHISDLVSRRASNPVSLGGV